MLQVGLCGVERVRAGLEALLEPLQLRFAQVERTLPALHGAFEVAGAAFPPLEPALGDRQPLAALGQLGRDPR